MKHYILISGLTFLCTIATLLQGCTIGFNIIQEEPCHIDLPQEVINYFNGYGEKFEFFSYEKVWSIEEGTHEDLYSPRFGIIESKKYKWKTNVKYEPHLYYENEEYALIREGSQVDKIRIFSPVRLWWIVLRKKDGKIMRTLEQEGMITDKFIFDEVLYLKMIYSYQDPRTICLKIGE